MQSEVPSPLELPQRMQPDQDNTGCSREKQCLVLRATAAAQTLANIIRPCFGPYGRQKFLVMGDGETICTGDAASILRVLQLDHPAAQLVREAARTQMEMSGDSTAFVVLLTEALLEEAELLLQAGLPRTQLREAFATAFAEAQVALPSLSIRSLGPLEDPAWVLYSVMSTQTLSNIEYLTKLVAHVCWAGREPDGTFRPERVGLCLVEGGRTEDSCILPGLAIAGKPCGQITAVLTGARVALYLCDFGPLTTDAPATPRLSSEEELRTFRRQSEEMENEMTQLATMDINVAVIWGKINKKMLTQADKSDVMVIQATSRKEMTYLSEVMGTPLLTRLLPPLEAGKCQKVYSQDVGNREVMLFEWTKARTPAFTVVLRGPTPRGLRAMEQAIYHGIDVYSHLCEDPRLLPGAGATEMALSRILTDKGRKLAGPNGPVFLAFARALRSLPKTLAENAGLAVQHVLAEMNGLHQAGNFLMGVGAEGLIDVTKEEVWDILKVKAQGLQLVAEVVQQLVTVDEIIVARRRPVSGQTPGPDSKEERALSSQRKKFFGNYTC